MLTPMTIAERALGLALGAGGTALKAAGGIADAVRGGGGDDDRPAPPKTAITDTALARKVESELFRDPSVPKGKINVNAVGRVVYLRGEAKTPQMVNDLQARALAIPEVDSVENLLHLPKTPARKPRAAKPASPTRKRPATRRVNAERQTGKGEPTPKEMAARREGRKAAPLGSTDGKGSKAGTGASKRPATRRVNAERQTGKGEPTPKEMAAKGQGRKPAPMGSNGSGS